MRRLLQDGIIALLLLGIIGYSFLETQEILFGFTVVAGLTISYTTGQRGNSERAVVLAVLWGVLAGATWTARLEVILPSIAGTAIVYLLWTSIQGRGPLSI